MAVGGEEKKTMLHILENVKDANIVIKEIKHLTDEFVSATGA